MAAPLLKQSRGCLLDLWLRNFDPNTRSISVLRKCFAKARTSKKQKVTPVVSVLSGEGKESIEIPNKITRSPTAILEALAKTVSSDVNKPLYQNIDDPALLSYSDGLTRHHLAAFASGKKAAQAMIAMNPEHYTNFWDEPLPETFDVVFTGYKLDEPCEEALLERIGKRKVKDSIQVYNTIRAQGGEIRKSTLELFLDLLTVFNHQDLVGDDIAKYIEPDLPRDSPFPASTWKSGCLAEEVFHSLPEKSSKAYCSLINGIAQNFDKEKAFELFREAQTAGVKFDVFTYNSLLSIASLNLETMEDIIREIEFLLKDMVNNNVSPNVETFNAALKNCTRISRWRGSKQYALSIMSEMKACGIEPSLGTWHHILSIFYFYKDKAHKKPDIFKTMLQSMKDKSYELEGSNDVFFFRTAMRVITNHLPDSKLALELHDILKAHGNFDCIGNRQLRFAYFKDLFLILAPLEHTDLIMEIYDSVVPFIFMPSQEVFVALFENIETFDAYHHIPRLYPDIDASSFFMEKGSIPLFSLIAQKKHEPKLQQQLCDISSAFLERWTNSQRNRTSPYFDGKVIGDMIMIHLNGDNLDQAQSLLQLYRNERKLQATDPSDQSLQALTEALIASNDFASTKDLLTLMNGLGCENVTLLVSKTLDAFTVSDQERNYLEGLSQQSSSSTDSSSDSDSDSC